jgi:ubiquinone/menaquinone biosynthesis C-methylase UbiE
MENIRVLDDSQTEAFDVDYMYEARWLKLKAFIDRDFPDGKFSLLDVGGGNGNFADLVLRSYPEATAVVVDLSDPLLAKNTPNPRKKVLKGSATELQPIEGPFDIVCCNWLLHHLVGDTYRQSLTNIEGTLAQCRRLLTPRGRVCIWENRYDGMLVDGAPGWLIYSLTSMRSIAKFTHAMGANTAGVGVCFQSRQQWKRHFSNTGLKVRDETADSNFHASRKPSFKRLALHLKPVGPILFWLEPAAAR